MHARDRAGLTAIFGGVILLLLAVTTAMRAAGSDKRPITEKDLLKFHWVADPEISPDGRQVAYVLVSVNEKEDRYDTGLWCVDTSGSGEPRQLTAGPRDSAPRWSPNGQTLAFLRAGEKDPPQIYLLSMQGGEGRKWTDLPRAASPPVWSPDGRTIAFASDTTEKDLAEKRDPKKAEKKSDVRVITRAVYRANGQGWLEPDRPDHIWTIAVPADAAEPPAARQITTDKYDEAGIRWSRDGSKLYFTADRVDEPYYYLPHRAMYSVPATGGELTTVIDIDGPVNGPVVSPDDQRVAFLGWINPPHARSNYETGVMTFANGKAIELTAKADLEAGSDVGGDQAPPRGGAGSSPIVWTADGRAVIVAATVEGRSNLVRVDAVTGQFEPVTRGDHDVIAYTATPDAAKFALTIGDATHIGDLYILDVAAGRLKQLTHVNDPLWDTLEITAPEEFTFTSFDGKRIEGWIQKPPDFTPGKKYPMILEIHGGPHSAYGDVFMHEFHWLAGQGYVVVYMNPRGSTSYGRDFANIIQYHYPGDDYRDLMVGVDEVLKRGYVDETRMGVTGGSGGGLLTNWTVTQTQRFKAAVSQRSVADWTGFWYSADFSLFTPSWFRKNPYEDPQEFVERSPVRYASKITTPMMFVEGDSDLRTPPSQGGEAMFRALKAQKKTAVMVRFPGETHELSRSGKPEHRIERLEHITAWFDKYLQGKEIKTYDQQ